MNIIKKMDRWVWYGGALLAFIAGMVNAVGFLSFDRHAITHLTGTTTELGMAVAGGEAEKALHFGLLIVAFVFGCVLSGAILKHNTLKLGRLYGLALGAESALLFGASALLRENQADGVHFGSGIYLASIAIGLQNAMASTYSGTLLRTTHLTGMFTDIGVALGHWIARTPVDYMRLKLCFLIITSFAAGSGAGAWLFRHFAYNTLYFPAALTGGVAILYATYSHWKKPKEKIETGIKRTTGWIKKKAKRRRQ